MVGYHTQAPIRTDFHSCSRALEVGYLPCTGQWLCHHCQVLALNLLLLFRLPTTAQTVPMQFLFATATNETNILGYCLRKSYYHKGKTEPPLSSTLCFSCSKPTYYLNMCQNRWLKQPLTFKKLYAEHLHLEYTTLTIQVTHAAGLRASAALGLAQYT